MSAMNTPPMRLLNVVKRMRGRSPGTARMAVKTPRSSTRRRPVAGSCTTPRSGMVTNTRCTRAAAVATIAMRTVGPMPSSPTDSPENTLVTMNATPCTVPTSPFARSRRSAGTSRVTVVDRAMFRRFSTTPPTRITPANSQNHGPPQSTRTSSGNSR